MTNIRQATVTRESSRCFVAAGRSRAGKADTSQEACGETPDQQWSVDYLGNGYYRLSNRKSGKVLEVAGGSEATQDDAAIQQGSWTHSANQQWRFVKAEDGWSEAISACGGGQRGAHSGSCGSVTGERWRIEPLNDGTIRLVALRAARTRC